MAPTTTLINTSTPQNLTSSTPNSTDITNFMKTPSHPDPQFLRTQALLIILGITLPIVAGGIYFLVKWLLKRLRRPKRPRAPSIAHPMGRGLGYAFPLPWRRRIEIIEGRPVQAAGRGVEGGAREEVHNLQGEREVEGQIRSQQPVGVDNDDVVTGRVIEGIGGEERNRRNLRREAGIWSDWVRNLRAQEVVADGIELGEIPQPGGERREGEEPEVDNRNQEQNDGSRPTSSDESGEEADAQHGEGAEEEVAEQLLVDEPPPPYSLPKNIPWDIGARLVDGDIAEVVRRNRE